MPLSQGSTGDRSAHTLAVIIATCDRESMLANRALASVTRQTRRPDYLIVVDDSAPRHREANRRIVDAVQHGAQRGHVVRYLVNDRTPGASGAWNVGLDWLHRQVEDVERVMVAILDDDDEWEPDYLAACAAIVERRGADMIAADIVRHEDQRLTTQRAPDKLETRDAYVRNAGIQGSNLFVRLSKMLGAGLFDEALSACTDRDLCIRLAALGTVRYQRLPRALVHHYADADRPRLSIAGSERKLAGLDAFYRKHHRAMTAEERVAFGERAQALFGWSLTEATPRRSAQQRSPKVRDGMPFPLVVGVITPPRADDALRALLDDLTTLRGDPGIASMELLVLENGPRDHDGIEGLRALLESRHAQGIDAVLIPFERQVEDAQAGAFGGPFRRAEGRVSIALARTMVQTYAHVWVRHRPGAIVWILDDDMRLDSLVWRGGARVERRAHDIVDTLLRLRDEGVDIAIGSCTEAPPLPFASCVRTQLVDAWHNLAMLSALSPEEAFPALLGENMALRGRFRDYYYDLSRRETDHLEMPFWYVPEKPDATALEAAAEMVGRLHRIFAGEEVFRPLVHDDSLNPIEHLQPSVHRGGNTFVFNHAALGDFPNGSPVVDGEETRRSDMVWCLLNHYCASRRVVKAPVPVRQHRGAVQTQRLDLEKLARDIQGYAAYSALEDVLLARREGRAVAGAGHLTEALDLTPEEEQRTVERFKKFLTERLYAFQLSFFRAAGVGQSLARMLAAPDQHWWLDAARAPGLRERLASLVALVSDEFDPRRLGDFRRRVLSVDGEVVREWLRSLQREIAARRAHAARDGASIAWLHDARAALAARWMERELGVRAPRLLGAGAEGVVFESEGSVLKCFDTRRLDDARACKLVERSRQWTRTRSLKPLRAALHPSGRAVLSYAFEATTPYEGGRGRELRALLDALRSSGVAHRNLHPDNLRVAADGAVQLVDYGVDLAPLTDEAWAVMTRRAYLSARYAKHPALKALLRASVHDGAMPELVGLDRFLSTPLDSTKESLLDHRLEAIVLQGAFRRVADYGCGKGQLAAALARRGLSVTGYDPDPGVVARWRPQGGLQFVRSPEALPARSFDVVLCALVLCVIEDDDELARVIDDLARLIARGGEVVVAVCNPESVQRSTLLQRREGCADPSRPSITRKTLRSGASRSDVHRPTSMVCEAFRARGMALIDREETRSFDPDTLEPSSDFLIMRFSAPGAEAHT